MKFIWLITILLICLRLCFCFLCCNTSLPALPAFMQCLTDSHFAEQTEEFRKNTPLQAEPAISPKIWHKRETSFRRTHLLLTFIAGSPGPAPVRVPAVQALDCAEPPAVGRAGGFPGTPRLAGAHSPSGPPTPAQPPDLPAPTLLGPPAPSPPPVPLPICTRRPGYSPVRHNLLQHLIHLPKPSNFVPNAWLILSLSYYYPESEVDEFQFHYQDLSSSQ